MTQDPADKVRITRMLGKFWTAANMLSLARLILVVPIAYYIWMDASKVLILALVILGVITDFFDGRVARWSHTVSDWGKVLDPVADKSAAIAITGALALKGAIPLWFVIYVAARDILIVLGGIVLARRKGMVVMSLWIGKIAVGFLALTVLAALLEADKVVMDFCVWTTTALLVLAQISYFFRFVRLMRVPTSSVPVTITPSELENVRPEA